MLATECKDARYENSQSKEYENANRDCSCIFCRLDYLLYKIIIVKAFDAFIIRAEYLFKTALPYKLSIQ